MCAWRGVRARRTRWWWRAQRRRRRIAWRRWVPRRRWRRLPWWRRRRFSRRGRSAAQQRLVPRRRVFWRRLAQLRRFARRIIRRRDERSFLERTFVRRRQPGIWKQRCRTVEQRAFGDRGRQLAFVRRRAVRSGRQCQPRHRKFWRRPRRRGEFGARRWRVAFVRRRTQRGRKCRGQLAIQRRQFRRSLGGIFRRFPRIEFEFAFV